MYALPITSDYYRGLIWSTNHEDRSPRTNNAAPRFGIEPDEAGFVSAGLGVSITDEIIAGEVAELRYCAADYSKRQSCEPIAAPAGMSENAALIKNHGR
jgi:hypothetical protein